ncbi:MAG: four helix bundle protein [Saprospiraceae bacterium]
MNESDLKERFLRFALDVYHLTQKFPKESVYFVITNQILRSSSSPGANYRAACRGKSGPDFINKLKIVEEELDESIYWFLYTNGVNSKWLVETEPLLKECNELLAITVSSIKTRRNSVHKN